MPSLNNEQLDDPLVFDGISDFSGGQASNRPANLLGPLESLTLTNVDIKTRLAVTRRGTQTLGSPTASMIQGMFYFSTPSFGYIFAIAGGTPWKYDETGWTAISGYTSSDSTSYVGIAQVINKLYIADAGTNLFSYDGSSFVDLGTGSTNPPTGSIVLAHTNRLFCAGNTTVPDQLNASTPIAIAWDTTNLSIRVGAGEGDPIMALAPWDGFQIVVFKRNSTYIVTADPSLTGSNGSTNNLTNATITKITDIGCVGPRAWALVGSDIYFLTDTGIRSLRRVITANTDAREVGPAMSEPVNDVIDRINWLQSKYCAGFFWQNKFFISLPIDNAALPNTVLVYDTFVGAWAGTWTGWQPVQFLLSKASGLERMNFGQPDGTVWRWLDYIPVNDELDSTFQDAGAFIATTIESRGFTFGDGAVNVGAGGPTFVDSQSYKSPFNVSAEFYQSSATASLSVEFDQGTGFTVNDSFITSGGMPLLLDFLLPAIISSSASKIRTFPTRQFNRFREIQVVVQSSAQKLSLRSLAVKAFADTIPPEE